MKFVQSLTWFIVPRHRSLSGYIEHCGPNFFATILHKPINLSFHSFLFAPNAKKPPWNMVVLPANAP